MEILLVAAAIVLGIWLRRKWQLASLESALRTDPVARVYAMTKFAINVERAYPNPEDAARFLRGSATARMFERLARGSR